MNNSPETQKAVIEHDDVDRTGATRCFVCGVESQTGLKLKFRVEGDTCRSEYTPDAEHIGFDNIVHGGLIFSALDDVMANLLFLTGKRGVTAKCEIRYRRPAAPGQTLMLEGRLESLKGRTAILQATAKRADDEELVADATGTFVLTDKV